MSHVPNAFETFTRFATSIRVRFPDDPAKDGAAPTSPRTRNLANQTASVFIQIGVLAGGLPLTMADCAAGFSILSWPRASDEPGHIHGRRAFCGDVAALAGSADGGVPARLAAVFRKFLEHLGTSDDPRHKTVAAIVNREIAELESA